MLKAVKLVAMAVILMSIVAGVCSCSSDAVEPGSGLLAPAPSELPPEETEQSSTVNRTSPGQGVSVTVGNKGEDGELNKEEKAKAERIAKENPEVQQLLSEGATIFDISLMTVASPSDQKEVIGMILLTPSDEQAWMVRIDLAQESVAKVEKLGNLK